MFPSSRSKKLDRRGCGALPKTCHRTAINKASSVERGEEEEEAARKELNKSSEEEEGRRWIVMLMPAKGEEVRCRRCPKLGGVIYS